MSWGLYQLKGRGNSRLSQQREGSASLLLAALTGNVNQSSQSSLHRPGADRRQQRVPTPLIPPPNSSTCTLSKRGKEWLLGGRQISPDAETGPQKGETEYGKDTRRKRILCRGVRHWSYIKPGLWGTSEDTEHWRWGSTGAYRAHGGRSQEEGEHSTGYVCGGGNRALREN